MKTLLKIVGAVLCMTATVQAAEVAELVTQLKGKDPEMRRSAAKELGEAGADAKTARAGPLGSAKGRRLARAPLFGVSAGQHRPRRPEGDAESGRRP